MATNFRKFVDGGIGLIPRSTDPSSPSNGDLFMSDGTPRAVGLWQYVGGAWTQFATPSSLLTQSTKTSAYTATSADQVLFADASSAAFTITLPAAASNTGLTLYICKIDSSANIVTIDGNSSETIDGSTTLKLPSQYDKVAIVSNGSNWISINKDIAVAARYTTGAGQVIPVSGTDTIVDFGTVDYDTHSGATVGSSWKFTVSADMGPGFYSIDSTIVYSGASFTADNNLVLNVYKGGSLAARLDFIRIFGTASKFYTLKGQTTLKLAVADYVDIRTIHDESSTRSLQATAAWNHVSIKKVR